MGNRKTNQIGFLQNKAKFDALNVIERYGPEYAIGFYAGCLDRLRRCPKSDAVEKHNVDIRKEKVSSEGK